jgi:hypothetical protein
MIMLAQALSVEDLSSRPESSTSTWVKQESRDMIPIVAQSVAMTAPVIGPRAVIDSIYLPSGWLKSFAARRAVSRRNWERFVAIRVTELQALPMDPVLRVGPPAVVDRHYNSLAVSTPPHPNLYAVPAGSQMLFRHAFFESCRLVLRPRALEYPLVVIELAPGETPSDLLVGRVCLCVSEL